MKTDALTPEFCERGYNIRAAVPEHPEYFARWAADSAPRARTEVDARCPLRPASQGNDGLFHGNGKARPARIHHGGYGARSTVRLFIRRAAVRREGIDVAVIN